MIKNTLYKFLISALFVFFTINTKAQVLSLEVLDTTPTYNLENVLKQDPLKVYKLNLKKQKLTALPEIIFQFKNLQVLNLRSNKFKTFPKNITTFKYLQELIITANQIEIITKELGDLIYLKRFVAGSNDIVSITPEIKNLKELIFLDLWGNNIGYLPLEIQELKDNLKEIDMRQIKMTKDEHKKIEILLPNTKIRFSESCNCGF